MRFGSVPVAEAAGGTLAHSVQAGTSTFKKGEVLSAAQADALSAAGVRHVVVSRLDPDDVGENAAAQRIADALAGDGLAAERAFTGRANLFATVNGVFCVAVDAVERLNMIDESLTLATLPPFRAVVAGEMVATVKIIPFAVPGAVLTTALERLREPVLVVRPYRPLRIGVLSTVLPGLKASVVRKTLQHLADRLAPAEAPIVVDEALPHDASALAARLCEVARACDIVVVFGASAIADRRDVIPAALLAAGGTIAQFGMPVDPGNLLLLGRIGRTDVIGAPGCARSPRENGFDWVLQRLLAGLTITPEDIRRLGVGGLLMEITTRPQPRRGTGPVDP